MPPEFTAVYHAERAVSTTASKETSSATSAKNDNDGLLSLIVAIPALSGGRSPSPALRKQEQDEKLRLLFSGLW